MALPKHPHAASFFCSVGNSIMCDSWMQSIPKKANNGTAHAETIMQNVAAVCLPSFAIGAVSEWRGLGSSWDAQLRGQRGAQSGSYEHEPA
mmetsp:Transcript_21038/g.44858  ORF Transcript_21038/g.44858 Transcript_21038/m.44858 type:complete len:91 (+) Transcript_21038:229-501(+)